ncbi:class I SAM-dependent methyltransferase [Sorangium sp. So ce388]|uniref:class I SAM-dependent methyltransferase n=1 Tax=Sorangium sp. So ce388 TaxID=3133309 RepID=UPI003F5C6C63
MTTAEVTGPGLFEGTAGYYARYRPGYPDPLFALLIDRFQLGPSSRVLDLGCGTGQIAIPLARRGVPVHAVDPDLDMLAEGQRAEALCGVLGIAWQRGDDKTVERLCLPPITLCAMGASFHWMDRDAILVKLDRMLVAGGGVAIISGGASVWSETGASWPRVAKSVVVEFLGEERRAGSGTYSHPSDRHATVLARSVFGKIEAASFEVEQVLGVDDIIGLQLSTSYASPAQLGGRLDEFKSTLRQRLLDLEPSGEFRGNVTTDVLVAMR